MGICLVRSAPEFERCSAAVFWHGRFFEGLRVVDASGQTHEIVRSVPDLMRMLRSLHAAG